MKDENIKEGSYRLITPSLNMCDMDERDWTTLESSSVSIVECSCDEDKTVSLKEQRILKASVDTEVGSLT